MPKKTQNDGIVRSNLAHLVLFEKNVESIKRNN